jgi:rubredoxin
MPKINLCDRCSLYACNPHLVCAVHPNGLDSDRCLDFRPDSNAEIEEQWSPQGYSWYGDELISNKPSRYTQEEQLEMLDNHPFFTGFCPQCNYKFDRDNPPQVHWDCPECGWIDDSV